MRATASAAGRGTREPGARREQRRRAARTDGRRDALRRRARAAHQRTVDRFARSERARHRTGSNADGTLAAGLTCNDWTSASADVAAQVGHSDGMGPGQSTAGSLSSWNSAREPELLEHGAQRRRRSHIVSRGETNMKRLLLILVSASVAIVTSSAQSPAAKPIPRTPDGKPDFTGNWTNATITPFERTANRPTHPHGRHRARAEISTRQRGGARGSRRCRRRGDAGCQSGGAGGERGGCAVRTPLAGGLW